jgi:hypothetical protein
MPNDLLKIASETLLTCLFISSCRQWLLFLLPTQQKQFLKHGKNVSSEDTKKLEMSSNLGSTTFTSTTPKYNNLIQMAMHTATLISSFAQLSLSPTSTLPIPSTPKSFSQSNQRKGKSLLAILTNLKPQASFYRFLPLTPMVPLQKCSRVPL